MFPKKVSEIFVFSKNKKTYVTKNEKDFFGIKAAFCSFSWDFLGIFLGFSCLIYNLLKILPTFLKCETTRAAYIYDKNTQIKVVKKVLVIEKNYLSNLLK